MDNNITCVGIGFASDGGSVKFGMDYNDIIVDHSKVTPENFMEMYEDKIFYIILNNGSEARKTENFGKYKKTDIHHKLIHWITDETELSEMTVLIHEYVLKQEKKSGERNDWYWDRSSDMATLRRNLRDRTLNIILDGTD